MKKDLMSVRVCVSKSFLKNERFSLMKNGVIFKREKKNIV